MSHPMSGISRKTFERDARLHTATGRAVALVAWTAASALIVAGFALGETLVIILGLLVWIPSMAAVNVVAGGVTVMREDELDERELALREQALAAAHRFTGVVLVATLVVAALTLSASVSKDTVLAVLAALMLLGLGSAPITLALRARVS